MLFDGEEVASILTSSLFHATSRILVSSMLLLESWSVTFTCSLTYIKISMSSLINLFWITFYKHVKLKCHLYRVDPSKHKILVVGSFKFLVSTSTFPSNVSLSTNTLYLVSFTVKFFSFYKKCLKIFLYC